MRFVYVLILLLFVQTQELLAQDALPLVFFQKMKTMRGDFQQIVFDKDGRKTQEISGDFHLMKPDKFRWNYKKPYVQTIVGDGVNIWLYDPDLQQVTVRSVKESLKTTPAAILLESIETLRTVFDFEKLVRQDKYIWLKAIPKTEESQFAFVVMGFQDEGNLKQMEITDHFGNLTVLVFDKVVKNPKLKADVFHFTPPQGVDVLEE